MVKISNYFYLQIGNCQRVFTGPLHAGWDVGVEDYLKNKK